MNELNMNIETNDVHSVPQNMKIDAKAVKRLAGEAISQVNGVLGLDGGITDVLKANDDVTNGLSINSADDDKTIQVSAKIITEYGKNIPDIVTTVQDKVQEALLSIAGLTVDKVEVEVTDTMTREEYTAQNRKKS